MEKSANENEKKFSCSNLSKKAKILIIIFASLILFICIVVPLVLLSFHKIAVTEVSIFITKLSDGTGFKYIPIKN
jgi:hypothetical protein